MENSVKFEVQFASIAEYYNRIVELRRRQKDDGIMIRIFLDEIIPMYQRLMQTIEENMALPSNVKERLLEIVKWEMDRAAARDAKIKSYEDEYKAVFDLEYEGDLAESKKLEAPFAIIADYYNEVEYIRNGHKTEFGAKTASSKYKALKEKVAKDSILTAAIKEEILNFLDEEIRQIPIREEELKHSADEEQARRIAVREEEFELDARGYAEEYAKAYNAALDRYQALSPLLKQKFVGQLRVLTQDKGFASIKEINKLFVTEEPTKKPEKPESPGDDGEHDGH